MNHPKIAFIFSMTVLCSISAGSAQTPADTSYWHKYLEMGATVNQAAFSDNWKAGGIASLSINLMLNGHAEYAKDRITWTNILNLLYGTTKIGEKDFRKSNDLIFLDSKFGYRIKGAWSAFVSVNFQSQFDKGFNYIESKRFKGGDSTQVLISNFLSPAYITEAIGIEYKPANYFFVRISPLASRQVLVNDSTIIATKTDGTKYGVLPGKKIANQIGFQILSQLDKDVYKNINLKVRYLCFGEYEKISENYISNRLDVFFTAKLTRYVSTNANITLLFDKAADNNMQTAQALGIGLLYVMGKK